MMPSTVKRPRGRPPSMDPAVIARRLGGSRPGLRPILDFNELGTANRISPLEEGVLRRIVANPTGITARRIAGDTLRLKGVKATIDLLLRAGVIMAYQPLHNALATIYRPAGRGCEIIAKLDSERPSSAA